MKYFYATVVNGRLQFYNDDGSKCIDNKIAGAVNAEIAYHPHEGTPVIKISYPFIVCQSEDEIEMFIKAQNNY